MFWCVISLLNIMFSVEFDRMLIFQGFEDIFCVITVIFGVVKSDKMLDFSMFCRTHYRTRKWWFRCGNNRCAIPGNRLSALKCKPRPLMTWKHTIIVQYYYMFYGVKWNTLHLQYASLLYISKCDISSLDIVRLFWLKIFL